MIHPEGHKLRPAWFTEEDMEISGLELDPVTAHMYCRNCGTVNPEPGSECDG